MRTYKKIIKFIILCTVFFCELDVHKLNAEDGINYANVFMPKFSINQKLAKTIKGNGFYSASIDLNAPAFGIYTKLKSFNTLPRDLRLLNEAFSFRFSPLYYIDDKQIKPALSFFYGTINMSSSIKKLIEPDLKIKGTSYSGIKFFPDNFLKNSRASKKDISKACEFSIKNFNVFILTEQSSKKKASNIHFGLAYKNRNIKNGDINFALAFYSCLYPNLNLKPYDKFSFLNYNQVYAGEVTLITEHKNKRYKLSSSGAVNLPTAYNQKISLLKKKYKHKAKNLKKEKIAAHGKFEFNYLGDYLLLNTGIALKDKDFFNIKRKKQKEVLIFYMQPKIILGNFEIKTVYNLSKNYNFPKKKKSTSSKKPYSIFHSGGIDLKFRNSNYTLSSGLFYQKKNYTSNLSFKIRDLAYWQNLFLLEFKVLLQDKKINPLILKKYSGKMEMKFNCSQNLKLALFGKLEHAYKTYKPNKIKYDTGAGIEYTKKLKLIKHSLNAKLGIKNTTKEAFYFSISYKLSSRISK